MRKLSKKIPSISKFVLCFVFKIAHEFEAQHRKSFSLSETYPTNSSGIEFGRDPVSEDLTWGGKLMAQNPKSQQKHFVKESTSQSKKKRHDFSKNFI